MPVSSFVCQRTQGSCKTLRVVERLETMPPFISSRLIIIRFEPPTPPPDSHPSLLPPPTSISQKKYSFQAAFFSCLWSICGQLAFYFHTVHANRGSSYVKLAAWGKLYIKHVLSRTGLLQNHGMNHPAKTKDCSTKAVCMYGRLVLMANGNFRIRQFESSAIKQINQDWWSITIMNQPRSFYTNLGFGRKLFDSQRFRRMRVQWKDFSPTEGIEK